MSQVSVIIVSWNGCAFLRECLLSLGNPPHPLIREIIVIDNASTDGSPEMVEREFPAVTLIRSAQNLGFARANNLGIDRASGSWFLMINSDVIVHPGSIEKLVGFLETHDDVGLVGPKILGANGLVQHSCFRLPDLWNTACRALALDKVLARSAFFSGPEMRHMGKNSPTEVEALSGCFWFARRAAVETVGGLDERFFFYAEDLDWCKRFRDIGWKIMFVPEASATHFGGGSSSNSEFRYDTAMLEADLEYWKKHRRGWHHRAFYLLLILHHAIRVLVRGLKGMNRRTATEENIYKYRRSLVCLRWLFSGKV